MELRDSLTELFTFNVCNVDYYFLIYNGAPKSVCSSEWLARSGWTPTRFVPISDHISPLRFAGHTIRAVHVACHVCTVRDYKDNAHKFHLAVFVLPPAPVPYLTGLQDQWRFSSDICLREVNYSHIKITKWNVTLPFMVTSYLWLRSASYNPAYNKKNRLAATNWSSFQFPSSTSSNHTVSNPSECMGSNTKETWKRPELESNLLPGNILWLHQSLKHPEKTSLLKISRQYNSGRKVPKALVDEVVRHDFCDFDAYPKLPRVPKLSLTAESHPKVVVSLNAMSHIIHRQKVNILLMLDSAGLTIRLKSRANNSAPTAFHAYFSKWIAYFDSPVYALVDRGSNLSNALMNKELRNVHSHLCPIPTETPRYLGLTERSHLYLHRAIYKLNYDTSYDTSFKFEKLLADIEIGWIFCQHTNQVLPHLQHSGFMPRIIGELTNPDRIVGVAAH